VLWQDFGTTSTTDGNFGFRTCATVSETDGMAVFLDVSSFLAKALWLEFRIQPAVDVFLAAFDPYDLTGMSNDPLGFERGVPVSGRQASSQWRETPAVLGASYPADAAAGTIWTAHPSCLRRRR